MKFSEKIIRVTDLFFESNLSLIPYTILILFSTIIFKIDFSSTAININNIYSQDTMNLPVVYFYLLITCITYFIYNKYHKHDFYVTFIFALLSRSFFGLSNFPALFGDSPGIRNSAIELLMSGKTDIPFNFVKQMPIIQLQYNWPTSWFVDGFFVNLTGLGLFGVEFLIIILDVLFLLSAYLLCIKLYSKSEAKLAILLLTIAPISMGYRWYSAQSFSLSIYFLILLPIFRLYSSNDFSIKNLSVIILLSLLIITSHSITSLVLLSTYFLLFVIKLINRDYRYTNLIILVYLLFILWNLSNSEADLLKPYLYNMINSSLSQIYMSIMYAISPSYSNSIGVNSVNSNLFEFLILYRYLFYIIIALFSAITVFYLIKKRMTYYLVLIGISQIFVIPFLSYISGNYVFRIITHWGMPLLCIFSSYAFIKQLSKKQFSLLYCMLFMLFFAYFISGGSLYKSYSSDTYSYYSMDHMKTYLSDVNSVAGSNHFYEYFLTESILSKSTTYLSYNGIDELLYSYNHLKNMLYIISKHHIAGINSDLGLLNNDDNLIFDSQYIQYYLNR